MIESARFWAVAVLLAFAVFFTFVSAVGVLRLPDIYARAHTASQVDTLGAGMALAAVALALGWQHATVYIVLLLFFVFITNPTAAHAIARSAADTGIDPWTTDRDERGPTDDGTPAASDGSAATDGGDAAIDRGRAPPTGGESTSADESSPTDRNASIDEGENAPIDGESNASADEGGTR